MFSTQAAPDKRAARTRLGEGLVLAPVPLLIDKECQTVEEARLPRRFILLLMLHCFDYSLELECIEFFFHRLLQRDRLSHLLEVFSATNVVMRWRNRKCWKFEEWLRVEGDPVTAAAGAKTPR
jgi:hypothetical protein